MKVLSFVAYPSYDRETKDDWKAYNATMALKGADFRGYADIKIYDAMHRITAKNTEPIMRAFGEKVVQAIGQPAPDTAIFVLPSSGCVAFGEDVKAKRLADAIIAAKPPVAVAAPFFWIEPLGKAAGGGGPRNASFLHEKLCFLPHVGVSQAILVDDVKTTGGHLVAASRVLKDHGISTSKAICFARTVWERPEKMFVDVEEELAD